MIDRVLFSRKRVLFLVFCLLILIDAGRSIFAHIGYSESAEPWQQAPYVALSWPPGSDLEVDAPLGERVYQTYCALCHGPDGRGDGPAAPSLIPRPRDFAAGEFKYKTTPADEDASVEDLRRTIENGLAASAMPYWKDILTSTEIDAVIDYIRNFSVFGISDYVPVETIIPEYIPATAFSLKRGKEIFEKSCAECHENSGRGDIRPAERKDDYPVPTRDLTAPWTFRGGSDPEELWLRLSNGMRPGPMPDFADTLTATERWDVVNYVGSLARIAPWESGGVLEGPGQNRNLKRRGEYLVHMEMCGLCHTQVNHDMIYSADEYYLAGGMGIPIYPHGVYVSRNLTPDMETGIGSWTVEEVAYAIRNGITPERQLFFMAMPWMYFHDFEEEDAMAIATYLKSRPAIVNQIPMPLHYGVIETVAMKIVYSSGMPPMGNPKRLIYKSGNYGRTEPSTRTRDWPQTVLVNMQWFVLALGIPLWVVAGPSSRRYPKGVKGWSKFVAVSLSLLVVSGFVWILYKVPVLSFIPPSAIASGASAGIPQVDEIQYETPEEVTMAERGRYLFTVSSCAFCHGNDGSGGVKINKDSFGTLWVRNITPNVENGIGSWSDEEISRAIRSGASRDGGPLHWQGMVWDHLSNLDEEDIRSLIVYLRKIPAVSRKVPLPAPPSDKDCKEYNFFLIPDDEPGC